MCNIWKSAAKDALLPEHMQKLPAGLRTVNLTGGEPFLRDDLPAFVREVKSRCPRATITISTNGYLTERILRMMEEIRRIDPAIRLAVSIDGVGKAHDIIRGADGFFDKAMELIRALLDSGFEGLRLSMTISEKNASQLPAVAELARSLGLELGIVAAHGASTHLGVEDGIAGKMPPELGEAFGKVVSQWLRQWRPKQWLRGHFAAYTYEYLMGRRWRFCCKAGEDFFFVQADGEAYNCSVVGSTMGNIIDDQWSEIWTGQAGCAAREISANCKQWCWMICTVRGVYRQNAAKVAAWILYHKLLAHLRLLKFSKSVDCGECAGGGDEKI
jgi:radical SAM protein with 4Fe4S-binding SPASM domain